MEKKQESDNEDFDNRNPRDRLWLDFERFCKRNKEGLSVHFKKIKEGFEAFITYGRKF